MIWLNIDMLKNPPVSTYFFSQKLDNIIRVFILLLILIKSSLPHATLVHRDLIIYKSMLI